MSTKPAKHRPGTAAIAAKRGVKKRSAAVVKGLSAEPPGRGTAADGEALSGGLTAEDVAAGRGNRSELAKARRDIFVREYMLDLNGARAARCAGWAWNSAASVASTLLREPAVAKAVADAKAARLARLELSEEAVLRRLSQLLHHDPRRLLNADGSLKGLHEVDDDTAAGVASFEAEEKGDWVTERDDEGNERAVWQPRATRLLKAKSVDPRATAELAMRHLGLLTDRLELGGSVTQFDADQLSRLSSAELAQLEALLGKLGTKEKRA